MRLHRRTHTHTLMQPSIKVLYFYLRWESVRLKVQGSLVRTWVSAARWRVLLSADDWVFLDQNTGRQDMPEHFSLPSSKPLNAIIPVKDSLLCPRLHKVSSEKVFLFALLSLRGWSQLQMPSGEKPHARKRCTCTKISGQFKLSISPVPQMHVFGLREEVGTPRENRDVGHTWIPQVLSARDQSRAGVWTAGAEIDHLGER